MEMLPPLLSPPMVAAPARASSMSPPALVSWWLPPALCRWISPEPVAVASTSPALR